MHKVAQAVLEPFDKAIVQSFSDTRQSARKLRLVLRMAETCLGGVGDQRPLRDAALEDIRKRRQDLMKQWGSRFGQVLGKELKWTKMTVKLDGGVVCHIGRSTPHIWVTVNFWLVMWACDAEARGVMNSHRWTSVKQYTLPCESKDQQRPESLGDYDGTYSLWPGTRSESLRISNAGLTETQSQTTDPNSTPFEALSGTSSMAISSAGRDTRAQGTVAGSDQESTIST